MNVLVESAGTRGTQEYVNTGKETISYRTPQETAKADRSGFVLDISGTVMDNSAYAGHGRTAEELIRQIEQEDVAARRNYMAVMSNSMSDEDFARLQKEGFHPGSTEIETVVTIVDQIKVALAKGGTEIAGYTDTVDDEALKDITGSEAFANELKKQFAEKDIPLTEENIASVTEAWKLLTQAGEPTDGSVKYMVENDLAPEPENFYTAKYSAASDGNRQGRGYYAAGQVAGYYAKKPEEIDFDRLRPQMEKVIEDAGYTADEKNMEDARWLVEKGIPLNEETFSLLKDIRSHQFPVALEDFMASAACAVADGTDPARADLGKKETDAQQALSLMEQTAAVQDEAADIIMARDLPFTLRNLFAVQNELLGQRGVSAQNEGDAQSKASVRSQGAEADLIENVRGRRLLEEVRLSMTVEANLKLLRRGFQIDTMPLEKLVDKLREAENSVVKALTGQVDESRAREKASLYEETLDVLQGIRSAPAAIVAKVSDTDTLRDVYEHGSRERIAYEKAGQSYETMMTEPRRDLGDSMQKAFRNVDDILESMKLEATEENRRVVRILGYNSLEITEENLEQIKEKDKLLKDVVKEMDPGRVLNMIREGVNPLIMPLEELGNYFSRQEEDPAGQMESYSRFLYKLEKQKGISEEEKSAYIGIYRLVRQIEKADDAAVGALWQTGAEFTLGNLLSALRSSKRGNMDYSVDDKFGGVAVKQTERENITDQIARGFPLDPMPGKEELEQLLEEAGDEEAGKEFDHMLYDQVRGAMKSEEEILKHLSDYEKPVTADNLMAAGNLLKNPKEIWKEFNRLRKQEPDHSEISAGVDPESFPGEYGEEVTKAFDGRDNAQKAYEGLQEKLRDMVERMAFSASGGALDVKAMSTLYKQFTFMGSMAQEENYEIPVNIDGYLTSINLKIVHSGQEESRVAVTFETQAFGKTAAEFKLTGQGLEGFCICSREEGTGLLKENQQVLEEKFKEEELKAGNIYFATGENLDLAEFSLKEASLRDNISDEEKGDDSGRLYRAARAFIGYVQEMSRKDVA